MTSLISYYSGLIGLIFFFLIFTFIIFWSFRPSKKEIIESYKYIPFEEKSCDRE